MARFGEKSARVVIDRASPSVLFYTTSSTAVVERQIKSHFIFSVSVFGAARFGSRREKPFSPFLPRSLHLFEKSLREICMYEGGWSTVSTTTGWWSGDLFECTYIYVCFCCASPTQ